MLEANFLLQVSLECDILHAFCTYCIFKVNKFTRLIMWNPCSVVAKKSNGYSRYTCTHIYWRGNRCWLPSANITLIRLAGLDALSPSLSIHFPLFFHSPNETLRATQQVTTCRWPCLIKKAATARAAAATVFLRHFILPYMPPLL